MPASRPKALLAAALVLPLVWGWVGAPTAAAAGQDGPCTNDRGVTVVVDYQELGGGVAVRCAPDFPDGGTGLDALRLAGFTPTGTTKDGPGFVCRIDNRPSADEVIRSASGDYRESCIATPPDWAFWSYWHANPGSTSWTFAQRGATREVKPGGYEGWSFSLDRTTGDNPKPGFKPKPPPKPEPSTTKPATTKPATTKPATTKPATTKPATTKPATTKPATKTPAPTKSTAKATQPPTTSPTPPTKSSSPAENVHPSTHATTPAETTSPVTTGPAEPSAPAASSTDTATAPPVDATPPPAGGSGWSTLLWLGGVAVIAGAGGAIWWRRRGPV